MPALSAPEASIDPGRCPLCGTPNQCALEIQRTTGVEQPPCWCTRVPLPPSLLARVAPPALGRACICRACASTGATDVTNILPSLEKSTAKEGPE